VKHDPAKEQVSPRQRAQYHDNWFWTWLWRSLLAAMAAWMFCDAPDHEVRDLAVPVLAGASALMWIAAFLHQQFEIQCCASNPCGDRHTMK
jgi:hypothetical protein